MNTIHRQVQQFKLDRRETIEQNSREQIAAIVADINEELANPRQRVQYIHNQAQPEESLRGLLSQLDHMRKVLADAKKNWEVWFKPRDCVGLALMEYRRDQLRASLEWSEQVIEIVDEKCSHRIRRRRCPLVL